MFLGIEELLLSRRILELDRRLLESALFGGGRVVVDFVACFLFGDSREGGRVGKEGREFR